MRAFLQRCGYFGDGGGDDDVVRGQLNEAYHVFKEWCRANKIYCSQPHFRAGMVSWIDSACLFFCDPTILPRFTTFYVCTCMPFDVIVCWGLR